MTQQTATRPSPLGRRIFKWILDTAVFFLGALVGGVLVRLANPLEWHSKTLVAVISLVLLMQSYRVIHSLAIGYYTRSFFDGLVYIGIYTSIAIVLPFYNFWIWAGLYLFVILAVGIADLLLIKLSQNRSS